MSKEEKSPIRGFEILIETSTPEIYRKNAFRISGLSVIASTQEITSRIQKNQMLEKYGNKTEIIESPFPIVPSPDGDQIRQALHRLREPETRIIDEFFWFWPHSIDSDKSDAALLSLARNDIKSAENIWNNYEATSPESNVSSHNLAILSHLMALDYELDEVSKSEELKKKVRVCWKEAFKRWKHLLDHEGFWNRLSERVRQLDDPRLTTGFVKRLRLSLPSALLQINAQLALKAAKSNNQEEAVRHLQEIYNSGFEKGDIQTALEKVIEPLRARINLICKSYSEQNYEYAYDEFDAGRRLLEQAKSILKIIDILLPLDDIIIEGAHDEVALSVIDLEISYANKTEDNESVLPIIEELKSIAIGVSAKERIKKNYNIFKSNIEYDKLHNTCFYCKKEGANKSTAVEVKMHGNVQRNYYTNQITWSYITIQVPRCEQCKKSHDIENNYIWFGGGAGFFLGVAGCSLAEFGNGGFWILATLIGIGFLTGFLIGNSKVTTAKIGTYNQFPQIKDLIKEGWTCGEKPATN